MYSVSLCLFCHKRIKENNKISCVTEKGEILALSADLISIPTWYSAKSQGGKNQSRTHKERAMEFLLLAVCVMSPHSEGMNLFSSGGGREGKRRKGGGSKIRAAKGGGKEWNGGKILGPIEYPPPKEGGVL